MRFKEILAESRMQDIPLDHLRRILPEYSQALAAEPIWRGLDHPDDPFTCKIAAPSQYERAAANTNNHSNMVVSNSPLWANYPKRNKAFICASDYDYASAYGSVYRILPRNNTLLGVCSAIDFWDSFSYMLKFNISFIELNEALGGMDRGRLTDTNYAGFKQQLDAMAPEKFDLDEQTDHLYQTSLKLGLSVSETLEKLLDPKANNIRTQNISAFNYPGREVWFVGECLVVHPEYMEELQGMLNAG